jgi:hypothetical protein
LYYLLEPLYDGWFRIHTIGYHFFKDPSNVNEILDVGPMLDSTATIASATYGGAGNESIYAARVKLSRIEDVNPELLKRIMGRDVQTGTTTTVIQLDANEIFAGAYLNRNICIFMTNAAARREECRCITSISTANKTVTVSPAFDALPAAGDRYRFEGQCRNRLTDDSITASTIAADAIGSSEIAADAIGASELTQAAADKVWTSTTRALSTTGNDAVSTAVWDEDLSTYTSGQAGHTIENAFSDTTLTCEVNSDVD